ncbi:polyphosphate polymerase domain-containing protein [Pseudarthrobacter chlorophenolicus]|uniref:polyphosphate polymerase domain-containing protein n=1 Tax=Pseudarthrobacter chlorophenolicus TaxID=85085 RepID=UPI0005F28C95|nr:polyphosphate polymerase domain-containing protein [Pseudarthrobacter chlorophenolicus]
MNPAGAAVGNLHLFPSVGLDELNAEAALQTRVDRKYVLATGTARQLLATFGTDMRVLEMDGARSFAYDSVYFDTAALDSYLLAAHGRRRRYKIRTRTYVDSAISFLEVKTEGAREATVKERIPYRLEDRSRLTAEGLDYVRETLAAAVGSVPAGPLEPVLETRYHRTTFYLQESGSRATIDTGVTWQRPGREPWVLDNAVILETKSGSTAGPLDRHLWAAGVRPSRISKFATGMAALRPELPANRWNRTLSRSLPLRPAA